MKRIRLNARPRHPEAYLADLRNEALLVAMTRHLMR